MKTALENFERRGFLTKFFETREEALSYICSQIENTELGIGGSVTVEELGLYEALLEKNNKIYWHARDGREIIPFANAAPVYISSANALSANGEIVNIDGRGNRLAATVFGQNKRIFFVCGINKLESNLEKAIHRAKNVAAPLNAQRLERKTPCAIKADKCHNCSSPERICTVTAIMTRPPIDSQVHIVIINEKLGY